MEILKFFSNNLMDFPLISTSFSSFPPSHNWVTNIDLIVLFFLPSCDLHNQAHRPNQTADHIHSPNEVMYICWDMMYVLNLSLICYIILYNHILLHVIH